MKRIMVVFLFFLLIPSALSLGVSTPVLEDNKLRITENGRHTFTLTLQNPEEFDVSVKVTLNGEIASILDPKEFYTLPAKSYDTKVDIELVVPGEALVGDTFEIRYSITPFDVEGGGTIPLQGGISKKFNVEVLRDPNKFRPGDYWAALIVVSIVVLLYVLNYYRTKNAGKKRS